MVAQGWNEMFSMSLQPRGGRGQFYLDVQVQPKPSRGDVSPPCHAGATGGASTYLLSPELLHQPLLLPQHLVLLAELPQQLLHRAERKGRGCRG